MRAGVLTHASRRTSRELTRSPRYSTHVVVVVVVVVVQPPNAERAEHELGAVAVWRTAVVRRHFPDGRFRCCVYGADGRPDEEWNEWYTEADQGIEWKLPMCLM